MHLHPSILLSFISIFLCTGCDAQNFSAGNAVVTVKGFYLGMQIEDACKLVNERFNHIGCDPTCVVRFEDGNYALAASVKLYNKCAADGTLKTRFGEYPDSFDNYEDFASQRNWTVGSLSYRLFMYIKLDFPFFVADSSGAVTRIYIDPAVSHSFFNSSGMTGRDFANAFKKAYGIPSFTTGKLDVFGNNIYSYIGPNGHSIEIRGYTIDMSVVPIPTQPVRTFGG